LLELRQGNCARLFSWVNAGRFGDKTPKLGDLNPSIVYLVAQDDTPREGQEMKDAAAPVWTFEEVERRLRAAVTTQQRQQTATADQIREMNECFSIWLPMITGMKYRNVVYFRSFTREKTGTPV
jgi:hypothetical protein